MKLSHRERKEIMERLSKARTGLLIREPFYGHLLMYLKFVLADCETAATDMESIFFDPEFVKILSDEDLIFVMKHEVLHCVLQHCSRAKNRHRLLYNIAADIVVNSMILQSMKRKEYSLTRMDEPVLHTAPDGREGRDCTAEEIYDLLYQELSDELNDSEKLKAFLDHLDRVRLDSHDWWDSIAADSPRPARWKEILRDVAGHSRYGDVPREIREWMKDDHSSQADWRQLLNDFIQLSAIHMDYTFQPADRRFTGEDYILPAFHSTEFPENLWFLVDTSASITEGELNQIFCEIDSAMEMIPGLSGRVSFFDTEVTEPVPFSSREDLQSMSPSGYGGTSFEIIFQYMQERMSGDLPSGVIIMTDGIAEFPSEEQAMGIPVLWVLINRRRDAPWGRTAHIEWDRWNQYG